MQQHACSCGRPSPARLSNSPSVGWMDGWVDDWSQSMQEEEQTSFILVPRISNLTLLIHSRIPRRGPMGRVVVVARRVRPQPPTPPVSLAARPPPLLVGRGSGNEKRTRRKPWSADCARASPIRSPVAHTSPLLPRPPSRAHRDPMTCSSLHDATRGIPFWSAVRMLWMRVPPPSNLKTFGTLAAVGLASTKFVPQDGSEP
jgi:hypothetical protein